MAKRLSEFTESLKQLGEIQVTDWDFAGWMNTDFDLSDSLRKLGNKKVVDLEFGDAMPTFSKIANKEVELPDAIVRAAQYKVLDWDFRRNPGSAGRRTSPPRRPLPDHEEMRELIDQLHRFLQFSVVNLVTDGAHAEIKQSELSPGVLLFEVFVTQRDIKDLIGRDGATASSIRGLLKARAAASGVHALLEVQSYDEALAKGRGAPHRG